jgi:hypothetical protein
MNILERLEKEKADVKWQIKTLEERLDHLNELEKIVTKAMENEINVHSHIHVNGKKEFPYRIKTRQEMIDGGCVVEQDMGIWENTQGEGYLFSIYMKPLHGRPIEDNERQQIECDGDEFMIDTWMITENK